MYKPSLSPLLNITLPSLPLPRSLFFLTCASSIASFLVFVFSMLDFGVLSFWVNPPAALITMLYHVGMLLVAWRKRTIEAPSYFSTVVVLAYILAVMWLVAFILTAVIMVSWKGDYRPESLHERGLPVTLLTQRLQCFLTAFEFIVVGGIGLKGHLITRKEGDPESWRPVFDSDKTSSLNGKELNDPKRLYDNTT